MAAQRKYSDEQIARALFLLDRGVGWSDIARVASGNTGNLASWRKRRDAGTLIPAQYEPTPEDLALIGETPSPNGDDEQVPATSKDLVALPASDAVLVHPEDVQYISVGEIAAMRGNIEDLRETIEILKQDLEREKIDHRADMEQAARVLRDKLKEVEEETAKQRQRAEHYRRIVQHEMER